MRRALLVLVIAGWVEGQTLGPRGGCYTITSSGRKRYVDRSLCASPSSEKPPTRTGNQPPPASAKEMPLLTITSSPSGAEIEIDGEYIGSTPTTLRTKEGKVTVKLKKAEYQPWERSITLSGGDQRSLNADLVKVVK